MSLSVRRARRAAIIGAAIAAVCSLLSGSALADGHGSNDHDHGNWQPVATHGNTHVVRLTLGQVRFRDAAGSWRPIDNTLVPSDKAGYAATNAANSFSAQLPADLATPVQISQGGESVGFALQGARGHGRVHGSDAAYAGALPSTDVTYAVGNAGVKESLILADATAPSEFSYTLAFSSGLTPTLNPSGGIDFVRADGSRAFAFAPPSMIDAAGATSERVRFKLEHGGRVLTLKADRRWLAASDRAWPVVVDPSFVANGADRECFIRNGADADTSFCGGTSIDVGTDGTQLSRSLLVWDLSSAVPPNSTVQNAQLGLYLQGESTTTPTTVDVNRATTPWTAATTWNDADVNPTVPWATPGGDYASPPAATAVVGGTSGVESTWDVTHLVQGWVDNPVGNDGMIVEQATESQVNVLHFATTTAPQTSQMPYLQVTYVTTPETTITSAPSGSTSATTASFAFTSDTYGSTFQCALDAAAFAACPSPARYSGLAVGSHTFQVRATSPDGVTDPTPASRTWSVTAGPANLLSNGSFEGTTAGWATSTSTLALANDGVAGAQAGKVTVTGGSSYGITTAPRPVSSTTGGSVYRAGGSYRGLVVGRQLCLVVREVTPAGSLVASGSSCGTTSTSWKQFGSLTYSARRSGDAIEVAVTQSGARSLDAFEVDALTLTQG